jgi:ubiquitin conjugation factor E4 B
MIERVASMLNYFLAHLAGPERRKLRLQNPEKHGWDPKTLLAQLCGIYLHLDAADATRSAFAAAVASDGRSYRDENFAEALHVTRALGLLREDEACALEAFAERVRAHAAAGAAEEEALGDAPDEFLDPIQCSLMVDPVQLPSGHVVDRAVIARHLLSSNTNPFTREPLTAEQLTPLPELAARIAAWRSGASAGVAGAGAMDTGA